MKLGTLCYIKKDDSYLLLHRVKKENDMHQGLWVGLGGKFEARESPEECVIREVYEESGLQIENPQLKGIVTFAEQFVEDWYVFIFVAEKFSGELLEDSPEGHLRWVKEDELADLPMHEGDRHFFKWINQYKGVFTAKLTYEKNKLHDVQINEY